VSYFHREYLLSCAENVSSMEQMLMLMLKRKKILALFCRKSPSASNCNRAAGLFGTVWAAGVFQGKRTTCAHMTCFHMGGWNPPPCDHFTNYTHLPDALRSDMKHPSTKSAEMDDVSRPGVAELRGRSLHTERSNTALETVSIGSSAWWNL